MTAGLEILVIDDRREALMELTSLLRDDLGDECSVKAWDPGSDDTGSNIVELLSDLVSSDTTLVVTDFDLSTAMRGLFGGTIVAWCNSRYVPVCNFSRQTPDELNKPGLFEFRLSPMVNETASEAARIFRGFRDVGDLLLDDAQFASARSPGDVLASLLGESSMGAQLAPYFERVPASNGALFSAVDTDKNDQNRPPVDMKRLLRYLIGHVLGNSILRFPGPILSAEALYALLGAQLDDQLDVRNLFEAARYTGPFADEQMFWRARIDVALDGLDANPEEFAAEREDVRARRLVSRALDRDLPKHPCDRCDGTRGGFWCPFTCRPVCDRSDCSVASSSWIPDGAWGTRVERDFYDEWAPAMGY